MKMEEFEYDDLSPSFDDLPMELILNIFRYLNFGDIRSASLTCRRWYEASQDSEFQSKMQLKFSKIHLSDDSLPGSLFLNTFRPFPNIYLVETSLGSVDNFFRHIGSTVEHIIIESVDITEEQFNAILKKTTNLKALTITNCSSLLKTGQLFETEADQEALAESLRNVKDISLGKHQYLSDGVLLRLTSLTPNLESFELQGFDMSFYPTDQTDYIKKSMLIFKTLLNVIENHVTTLKELNLNNILFEHWDMSLLVNIKGLDLRRIDYDRFTNFIGLDTILISQQNLVELNLSYSGIVIDRHVKVICEHLTNLEVLKLRSCYSVTDDSITEVLKLKRLKVLDISSCCCITTYGVQEGIAKAKNNTLLELYLRELKLSEACLIQCAENLRNLRVFDISYCVNDVTYALVQAINKNLIFLRFLSMDGYSLTSDNEEENFADAFHFIFEEPDFNNLRKKQVGDQMKESSCRKKFNGLRILHLEQCEIKFDFLFRDDLKFLDLRELMLSYCQTISLRGINIIVKNCLSIEVLGLSLCLRINDKCIEVITQCLQRLRDLDISGCIHLTNHSLDHIANNCKVLQILDISRCHRMPYDANAELQLSCLSTLRTVYCETDSD